MLFPSHFSYCMRFNTLIIPKDWLCEPCKSKDVSTSLCKVNQSIGSSSSKRQLAVKTGKVKFLDIEEVIRLSSGKASVISKIVISKIPSPTPKYNPCVSPPKVLGNFSINEVQKKPMTNQHASCSFPKSGIPCADAECNKSNIEKGDLWNLQENLNFHKNFLPSSIPTWRGQIQILQTIEIYDGFEAQPPCIINKKAYKFSREMPSVLQMESLPALNFLPDIFQDDSPKLQDIALYFFPSEPNERSRKNLNSILKFMNAEKSMLRSYIEGVELLVFTSNQLDRDSRSAISAVNAGDFLWGIFRQNKIDKAIERVPKMEPDDMDIDMIGGKDVVGRVDHVQKDKPKSASLMEFYNKLDVPPGF
ncbi:hypothetical protein VNO78_02778 [Psophocarpus tetragonolobus]|uniref:AIPP2-like SPOC-like domain-containing protein n=1 Tax=Psophocarpus tetragonolobus TaxID=3891 RepID=A0AAN9XV05_PSOTE